MQFFENTKRLAREFLSFKKYKQMNTVLAVFVGLFMSPFIIMFFVELFWTFINAIIFTIIEAPIKFLHKLIRDETQEHHLAFRIIIYYLSWPIVFGLYVTYALMMIDIVISYVITQAIGYVASLGGFLFHISPLDERIDKEVDMEQKHNKSGIVHVAVCAAILLITLIIIVVGVIIMIVLEESPLLIIIGASIIGLIPLFELFFAVLAYRDKKREKKEIEQPKPEEAPAQ